MTDQIKLPLDKLEVAKILFNRLPDRSDENYIYYDVFTEKGKQELKRTEKKSF